MTDPQMINSDHASESDGSRCLTQYLGNCNPTDANSPILVCFHGSGTDNHRNWKGLLEVLSKQYKTVFFDRGSQNPSPEEHSTVLWNYLANNRLKGPFVLIAHSYGGLFAKHLLRTHRECIGGVILVETGKGGSPGLTQESQIKKGYMGSQPLSVIRANSFLRQQQALAANIHRESAGIDTQAWKEKEEWLARCEAEDERLETSQLMISRNSRLVYLPDCGHNVIEERPDVVLQELQWIMEQYLPPRPGGLWLSRLKQRFLGSNLY